MQSIIVFCLGLFFGTATSILGKTLYLVKVDGKYNTKPIFQTFIMFLGMSSALILYYFRGYFENINGENEYVKLNDNNAENKETTPSSKRKLFFLLAIPATFDLVGTALAKQGLVYIDVSIYQLMRCALIISVALVRYAFLKARYSSVKKAGIIVNTVAVGLVASTSFFASGSEQESSTIEKLFGILLVLLSCFVQSVQYVFEETMMEGEEAGVHPLLIVGLEGFWGLVICIFIVLPVSYFLPGHDCRTIDGIERCCYEDTIDSVTMMFQSSLALWLSLAYVVTISLYNIFAVYVTYFLDSVWHAILDNFRPISVWLTQLVLFQLFNGHFGEKWTRSSFLQLAGLFVMLFGTALYNGSIWKDPDDTSTDIVQDRKSSNISNSPVASYLA